LAAHLLFLQPHKSKQKNQKSLNANATADFDDPHEQTNKKSPTKFIELLKEMTLTEDIEYYCCWEGDWNLSTENIKEIDIRKISLDKNYFGLTEKEFIKFRRQTTE
jgi:hypothetical protein